MPSAKQVFQGLAPQQDTVAPQDPSRIIRSGLQAAYTLKNGVSEDQSPQDKITTTYKMGTGRIAQAAAAANNQNEHERDDDAAPPPPPPPKDEGIAVQARRHRRASMPSTIFAAQLPVATNFVAQMDRNNPEEGSKLHSINWLGSSYGYSDPNRTGAAPTGAESIEDPMLLYGDAMLQALAKDALSADIAMFPGPADISTDGSKHGGKLMNSLDGGKAPFSPSPPQSGGILASMSGVGLESMSGEHALARRSRRSSVVLPSASDNSADTMTLSHMQSKRSSIAAAEVGTFEGPGDSPGVGRSRSRRSLVSHATDGSDMSESSAVGPPLNRARSRRTSTYASEGGVLEGGIDSPTLSHARSRRSSIYAPDGQPSDSGVDSPMTHRSRRSSVIMPDMTGLDSFLTPGSFLEEGVLSGADQALAMLRGEVASSGPRRGGHRKSQDYPDDNPNATYSSAGNSPLSTQRRNSVIDAGSGVRFHVSAADQNPAPTELPASSKSGLVKRASRLSSVAYQNESTNVFDDDFTIAPTSPSVSNLAGLTMEQWLKNEGVGTADSETLRSPLQPQFGRRSQTQVTGDGVPKRSASSLNMATSASGGGGDLDFAPHSPSVTSMRSKANLAPRVSTNSGSGLVLPLIHGPQMPPPSPLRSSTNMYRSPSAQPTNQDDSDDDDYLFSNLPTRTGSMTHLSPDPRTAPHAHSVSNNGAVARKSHANEPHRSVSCLPTLMASSPAGKAPFSPTPVKQGLSALAQRAAKYNRPGLSSTPDQLFSSKQ